MIILPRCADSGNAMPSKEFQWLIHGIAIDAPAEHDKLPGMISQPPENPKERSRLWTIFWLTLIVSPASPFLMALAFPRNLAAENGMLAATVGWSFAVVGAIVCGGILSKLTSKTGQIWGGRAVAFSLLFLLLFGICAFVGCAMILFQ
jgi:predicted permease